MEKGKVLGGYGKQITGGIIGLLIGILLTGVVMYMAAPKIMMLEDESKYGFEESVEKFVSSTKSHGWKIPATHDFKKSMSSFGMTDIKEVKVFELCHPDHAGKILKKSNERIVSSLMPCRVAIYVKDDGKTYISRMNSGLMAKTFGGLIAEVMKDASSENEVILEAIIKK